MIPENYANYKRERIVVALSGGVDSAVTALLLSQAGADVAAVFMKNWEDDDSEAGCHDRQDLVDAASVAEALGLDFQVVNFAATYQQRIFKPFLAALERGETPNPDVLCNSEIKFAAFVDYARAQGATRVATGHYAQIEWWNDRPRLYKSTDRAKDQTYFLHRLDAAQLSAAVFPIGGMLKSQVRDYARDNGLHNWARKDSTGLCFIGERHFREFLSRFLPTTPGAITDEHGRAIGEHIGLPFYTIGQRRGLGVGGEGEAWFVAEKIVAENRLLAVQGENHPRLFKRQVEIKDAHWIDGAPPPCHRVYEARLRHRQIPDSCTLTAADATTATIAFAKPQRAVTPGQYAVVYDGNVCLGGGVISDGE